MTNTALNFLDHIDAFESLIGFAKPALLIDFDGTLSELTPDPSDAVIDPMCLTLLQKLSTILPVIAIVSGRSVKDLQSKIQLNQVELYGNHGAEKFISGKLITRSRENMNLDHIRELLNFLKSEVSLPGLIFEDKTFSASVHYRLSNNHDLARATLSEALRHAPHIHRLETFWGKEILEIRLLSGVNKGYAVLDIFKRYQAESMLFIGDDTTDIDGIDQFIKLRDAGVVKGLALAVKSKPANKHLLKKADAYIENVEGVGKLLEWALKNYSKKV